MLPFQEIYYESSIFILPLLQPQNIQQSQIVLLKNKREEMLCF